jgi:methionine sulfoxide reductase heme-binding subunit
MQVPWRDRHGRLVPIKAAVLAAVCVPGIVYAWWWATDALQPRPVTEVIHGTGLWTVRLLLISLAMTPFARLFEWPRLLLARRIVGVAAMTYGVLHLLLYMLDQKFALLVVGREIATRVYLTIGFIALLGLVALGATSTDAAMRRLRERWKRLHRLAYPIAVLAILHYFIQSKANVAEPVFVAGLYVWLMVWRALARRPAWLVQPVLIVAATLGAAGIEFAWYGLATRVNPWRVLAANQTLDLAFLRPAHYVAIVCAVVAAAVMLRRLMRPRAGAQPRPPALHSARQIG